MDQRYNRLFKDTTIFAISGFGSKALSFLLVPLYTSVLSTAEYGTADLVLTTVNLLVPILTVSMSESVLRFAFDKNLSKRHVLSNSLLFVYVSTFLLAVLTPLCRHIGQGIGLYWTYLVLLFFLSALNEILINYLKSVDKVKLIAVSSILQTFIYLVSNIVFLVVFRMGVSGFLLSMIVGYACQILLIVFSKGIGWSLFILSFNWQLLKEMLIYSWPLVLSTVAWWINTSVDKYMITGMLSSSDNGLYSVAHKIPTLMTTLTTIFSMAWHISAISSAENDNKEQQSIFYSSVFKNFVLVSVLAFLFVIILNKPLASILFSKEFYVAWKYVPFLLLASLFSSYAGFIAAVFRACKKTQVMFFSTVIAAVLNILLNYFLIPSLGIFGAALATMTSFLVMLIVRLIHVKRFVDLKYDTLRLIVVHLLLIIVSVVFCVDGNYKFLLLAGCITAIFFLFKSDWNRLYIATSSVIRNRIDKFCINRK